MGGRGTIGAGAVGIVGVAVIGAGGLGIVGENTAFGGSVGCVVGIAVAGTLITGGLAAGCAAPKPGATVVRRSV